MQCKAAISFLAASLVCLGLTAPLAQAQGTCTRDSFTGTYVFYEKGSSSIFNPSTQTPPFHWAGAYAPFILVGETTTGPDGVGNGFFWIRDGSYNGGLDPIPFQVTITEMNEDCTGKLTTTLSLPGALSPTIEERFILFNNGREYRAIPTTIENGIPTSAWLNEGHRISKPNEPPNTCGPQTAQGTYVMSVENLVQFEAGKPIFADAVLLYFNVSMTGEYTGKLYEKLGPLGGIELPATGTITVNPDCSFASTLNLTINGAPVTVPIRGVFFDNGKKLYGLNMNTDTTGTLYSFGEGQRVSE